VISFFSNSEQKLLPPAELLIGGVPISVDFRHNAKAKRIILRLSPSKNSTKPDGVIVTLPNGVNWEEGLCFAQTNRDWISAQFLTLPDKVHFTDGATIPFLGVDHHIRHVPSAKRGVWCEDNEIRVSGPLTHLSRRTKDWLKREAQRKIALLTREIAPIRELTPGRITIRDTRSRWGSCAANGNLSFSWRLVLAPENIIEYVVAHEIAHLAEHNHSPKFWAVVDALTPHCKVGRKWLKVHGEKLHRYG
jgi:predicted metal-dependent hydrolase